MTHERAHKKHYRVVEWDEDQYDAFRFLANMWPSSDVDRELDALRFGPFLEVVKDVLDLLKGNVVLEATLNQDHAWTGAKR